VQRTPPIILGHEFSGVIAALGGGTGLASLLRGLKRAPLDITAITDHMIFNGLSENFPLLFTADDIAIYNSQGFLMQLLTPQNAGIFSIEDPGNPDSFSLTYDRHEFVTYKEQHIHQGNLALRLHKPSHKVRPKSVSNERAESGDPHFRGSHCPHRALAPPSCE
jgi:hypothetical protein